jgi:homoserine O-acetyltransferase
VKHVVTIDGAFHLEGGGTLHDVRVEVRTWGRHRRTATLICHALTGNADADDWWAGMFGTDHVFDPAESHIVAMNVLGGCAGTTGPTSVDPATGVPYGGDFPTITIRDMVSLQALVLDRLGIDHLDLVVGGSMGGMQVLEWLVMYPDRVTAGVPIGVGGAQSAWAIGLSHAQRLAIEADARFRGGHYPADDPPVDGLAAARAMAMMSYRSHAGMEARFGRTTIDDRFAIQSYLDHHGDALVRRFDANTYLRLVGAMDSHDVGRDRGPREAILRHITADALVIGISSDVLYPVSEVRQLAGEIPNARFAILDSPHGHDAFLIDTGQLESLIRSHLRGERTPVSERGRGAGSRGVGSRGADWA